MHISVSAISVIKLSHSKLRNTVFSIAKNCHVEGSSLYFWVFTDMHASATLAFLLWESRKHRNHKYRLIASWQSGPNTDQSEHKAFMSRKSTTNELIIYALKKIPSTGSLIHFSGL